MSAPTNPSPMVVTVDRDDMLAALRDMGRVTDGGALPVLGGLHLEADGEVLRVTATDLYNTLRVTIPAKVKTSGVVVACPESSAKNHSSVPAIRAALRAMPRGRIRLRVTSEGLRVSAVMHRREVIFATADVDKFPMPKWPDGKVIVTYPAAPLRTAFQRVMPFVSTDDTRPHVNSVLWAHEGMVATDGHRLALVKTHPLPEMPGPNVLVPRSLTGLVVAALAGVGDDVEVRIKDARTISFRAGRCEALGRLVDAQFPPYRQVMPASPKHSVVLPRVSLRASVEATGIWKSKRNGSKSRIAFVDGRCSITSGTPAGKVRSSFKAPGVTEAWETALESRYVLEALRAVGTSKVRVASNGNLEPVVIEPADGGDIVVVTMPVRV